MYFALKTDCYFRHYGDIGHLIRPIVSMEIAVDESGAILLEQLQYEPKDTCDIVKTALDFFSGVTLEQLTDDANTFFLQLANDGFLNFSDSIENFRTNGFEYRTLEGKLADRKINTQLEESSAYFLGNYFKENPFLETFHIELTSKCNERCVHCYIPHENKNTDIDEKLMIKALNQCKEMGVLTVIFSGGEPMLHPQFCKFLRYAKDLDFNVTILSNLTLLSDEIIEALKYRHCSCVNVSLYSMNPIEHDSITAIKGSFEKTKNNILRLISNDVAVQINCPIMNQNKNLFQDVIVWGQNHKCSVVTDYLITARYDRTTDNLDNRITQDDLKEVITKLVKNDVVLQTNIDSASSKQLQANMKAQEDDKICGVGMSTMCMVANGNIYPCAGWQYYVCGNLHESSLKDIWENSKEIGYLRNLRLKDFENCLKCDDYNYCLMCMGRNSNEDVNGSVFNIPQITCEAAKIHHEIVEAYRARQ